MSHLQDAPRPGVPDGPAPPFRAELERHRRWLAARMGAGLRLAEEAVEGPLVLVVEDDEGTRSALVALLEMTGYRVVATCLGEEAVRIAGELAPDVVLLDLVLPRASGLDTVHLLRAQRSTAAVPVIAMTALWLGEQPDVLASAGFDGALRKPYSGSELFAELERVLEAREGSEGRGVA